MKSLLFIFVSLILFVNLDANIINVPADQPTIQAGIDAATNVDTVLVADSTYYENINFKGKAITVASQFIIDGDTSHISNTIINGSQHTNPDSGSVVYFISGEDTNSVLSGFTITGGSGTPANLWTKNGSYKDGKMLMTRGSGKGAVIEKKTWYRTGGGIFCSNALGAKIINNRITHNHISGNYAAGGGLAFYCENGFLILENNHINNNKVTGISDAASGVADILANNALVRIVGNYLERDTVSCQTWAYSGAIWLGGDTGLASGVLKENVFRENTVNATNNDAVGGAIVCLWTKTVEIRDNLFENNKAKSKYGNGLSGAVYIEDTQRPGYGNKLVLGNEFKGNLAYSQYSQGTGGAIMLYNTISTISKNYFCQNTAQGGTTGGGAISISRSAFLIDNNIFVGNISTYDGGAIYAQGVPQSGSGMTLISNTFVNNEASANGGGMRIGNSVKVINSIFWGNIPDQLSTSSNGTITARYCDVEDGYAGIGNIDNDPLFADSLLYELSQNSPCIGAGIDSILGCVAPPVDYDGDDRPNVVDEYVDIGAQESPYLLTGITNKDTDQFPKTFSLNQNYPNPFNPVTNIEFSIPKTEFVTLKIYNLLGQEVATLISDKLTPGNYKYTWNASGFASGIYYYKIQASDPSTGSPKGQAEQRFVQTRKLILIK